MRDVTVNKSETLSAISVHHVCWVKCHSLNCFLGLPSDITVKSRWFEKSLKHSNCAVDATLQ